MSNGMDHQDWIESFESEEDRESFYQWLATLDLEQKELEEVAE